MQSKLKNGMDRMNIDPILLGLKKIMLQNKSLFQGVFDGDGFKSMFHYGEWKKVARKEMSDGNLKTIYEKSKKSNGLKDQYDCPFEIISEGKEIISVKWGKIEFLPTDNFNLKIDGQLFKKLIIQDKIDAINKDYVKLRREFGGVVPLRPRTEEMNQVKADEDADLDKLGLLNSDEPFHECQKFYIKTGCSIGGKIDVEFEIGSNPNIPSERLESVIDHINYLSVQEWGKNSPKIIIEPYGIEIGGVEGKTITLKMGNRILPSEFTSFLKDYGYYRPSPF